MPRILNDWRDSFLGFWIWFDLKWTTSFETFSIRYFCRENVSSFNLQPFSVGISKTVGQECVTYVVHARLKMERLRLVFAVGLFSVRQTSPCKITAKISLRGTFTRHLSRDNEPFLVISWRETRSGGTGKERGKGGWKDNKKLDEMREFIGCSTHSDSKNWFWRFI